MRMVALVMDPRFERLVLWMVLFNAASLAVSHATTVCLAPASQQDLISSNDDDGSSGDGDSPSCIRQAGGMAKHELAVLEALNIFFLVVFTLELCLKVVGLGPLECKEMIRI